MELFLENQQIIKGALLLILAIMGNYTGKVISCKVQNQLVEHMYLKHAITFLILYFAIDFTSEEAQHPVKMLFNVVLIYLLFLMFNKMNVMFTFIVFTLFASTYVTNTFINYYKATDENAYLQRIQHLGYVSYIMKIASFMLLLTGFSLYFKKHYKDYHKNWSTLTFLFGNIKCKSNNFH